MGQEIVYCSRCQVRIVGTDFEKGEAYRVGEQVACQKCAMEMLAKAPLAVQQQILDQKQRALDRKTAPSPSMSRGLTGSSTAVRTPTVAPSKFPAAAALAGIGVSLVLLVGMLVMSGGSPQPAPVPPTPPPEVVNSGPTPQEIAAQGALQVARSFARDNPAKLDEQAALFEKIPAGTTAAVEARRELEGIARKRKEAATAELATLLSRAREMGVNGEPQKAADLLEAAKKNHSAPEWTRPIEDRIKELQDAMAAEFPAIRDKAVEARKRDGTAEVSLMKDKVARWGSARYTDELEKALAEVFPPITPKNNGNLMLRIAEATLVGKKFKRTGEGDWSLMAEWRDVKDYVEWTAALPQAGTYTLKLNYTAPKEYKGTPYGGDVTVLAANQTKTFTLESTKTWGDFTTFEYGQVSLPSGAFKVIVRPTKVVNNLMSLRFVQLVPAK